ncbi:hypothetical protein ABPG77_000820 [Micractinium sp. CCAP 211/92]
METTESTEGSASGIAVRRVQAEALRAAEPWGPTPEGVQARRAPAAGTLSGNGDNAAAGPAPAAAIGTGSGAAGHAEAPWRRFRRERAARLARHDMLGASIFLAVLVAARFRVGEMPSPAQESHGLALLFLTCVVMMWGRELAESGWGAPRAALVLVLKFAAATCPLFRLCSQELFNEYPKASGAPALSATLLRSAVANHTGLLLLLGTILPQYIVADAVAQCLFFFSLSTQTSALCNTVFVKIALKTTRQLPTLGTMRGCVTYIATSQLWVGVMLPLLLSVRRESAAAVRFARDNGITPSDHRRRVYAWLHRATSLGDPLSAALAAGLAGAYAVWLAAAWVYLGRVYG